MKLESLNLEKFKKNALKKEQLFMLNGGGTVTGEGSNPPEDKRGPYYYGYDSIRSDGRTTYHNRLYFAAL